MKATLRAQPIKFLAGLCLLASIVLISVQAQDKNQENNTQYNYPGGIAEFVIEKQNSTLPQVKFGLREPVIIESESHWRILIGLSLDLLPGEYVTYIKDESVDTPGTHKKIFVKQKVYPFVEQKRLNASDKNWSVRLEHKDFSDIDFSNTQQPSLPLRLPMEGNWSDTFGHKIYDLQRQNLHVPNSISLATTQLGAVVAPQNAIVSKTAKFDDSSFAIFLDHGRGLYSIISGLRDLTVEVGNGVVAGAVIGRLTSGEKSSDEQTDLAAKRLVWQTVLNGVYVNPLILTELESRN